MSARVGATELTTDRARETQAVGERIGRALRGGDIVLLEGPLGAGKTTLTQGIARGLGVASAVRSPTFTLMTEYAGRDAFGQAVTLCHADLYRLAVADVSDIGLDDYLGAPGVVTVVEWPGRAGDTAWPPALRVSLMAGDADQRVIRLQAAAGCPPHVHDLVVRLAGEHARVGA